MVEDRTHPLMLALWAHPRSLSTVLERVVIERGDFQVLHEPFSPLYYLHERRATAIGARFDESAPRTYEEIRRRLLDAGAAGPVFFKDMCYHCHRHLLLDEPFLFRLTHVFLVRDPRKAIPSHYARNPRVTSEEIGYESQYELFVRLRELGGRPPPVIDADDLQDDPRGMVTSLWRSLGLDPRPDSLRWQPGHRKEWENWRDWHGEVADSSGIDRRRTRYAATVDNHEGLARLHEHHRPFYERMRRHRLGGPPESSSEE